MPGQEQHEGLVVDLPARRRRPPLVTREKVVEVAYGLVVAEGPDGLSMRKLAAALHVSLPTVYTAIRSREFLVQQLQIQLFDDIAAVLAAADLSAADERPGGDDRLTTMANTLLTWASENPRMAEFLLSEEFSSEVAQRVAGAGAGQRADDSLSYVVGMCRDLASKGELPHVDPLVGIGFTVAQIRAVLSLQREPTFESVPSTVWLDVARATVVSGLRALAPG